MKIAGVDWSLNGPAICVHDLTKPFCFENVDIYYLTKTQKYVYDHGDNYPIHGQLLESQPDDFYRWEHLKNWAWDKVQDCTFVIFENYSYGSRGRAIFNIAESTGIIKQKIWSNDIQLEVVPPSAAKKHFTDNGAADKTMMYNEFVFQTNINLIKLFNYEKAKIDSPIADIVDSFALVSYAVDNYTFNISDV